MKKLGVRVRKCTQDHTCRKYQSLEFKPCNLVPWPRLEITVFPGAIPNAGGGDGEPRLVGSCLSGLGEGGRAGIRNPIKSPGLCMGGWAWSRASAGAHVAVPDYLRRAQDDDLMGQSGRAPEPMRDMPGDILAVPNH